MPAKRSQKMINKVYNYKRSSTLYQKCQGAEKEG